MEVFIADTGPVAVELLQERTIADAGVGRVRGTHLQCLALALLTPWSQLASGCLLRTSYLCLVWALSAGRSDDASQNPRMASGRKTLASSWHGLGAPAALHGGARDVGLV